jgi:hypothetical protein
MTAGVLFFAYNNDLVDYIKQAIYNAKLVKKHLGLPVALVTDSVNYLEKTYPFYKKYIDYVIPRGIGQTIFTKKHYYAGEHFSTQAEWKNVNRFDAYTVTPFDTTIVLDTDYLISNDNLLKVIDQPNDLFIYKRSEDISLTRALQGFNRVSDDSIDFYWATVLVFKKTERINRLFKLVKYIKDNYHYFRTLYRITTKTFRNDYAFSIAIHMLNGYETTEWPQQLPGRMLYSSPEDDLVSIKDEKYTFTIGNKYRRDKVNVVTVENSNIHVMNKLHLNQLIDEEFKSE